MYNPELVTIVHGYRHYAKSGGNLSSTQVRRISNIFVKEMIEELMKNNEVHLPSRMGSMRVEGRYYAPFMFDTGRSNLPIDWQETKKLWEDCPACAEKGQKIYHLNEDTSGVVFRLSYKPIRSIHKYKHLFKLRFARHIKRRLAKEIKEGKAFYTKY